MFKRKIVVQPTSEQIMYWNDHPLRSIKHIFAAGLKAKSNHGAAPVAIAVCVILNAGLGVFDYDFNHSLMYSLTLFGCGAGIPIFFVLVALYFIGRLALLDEYKTIRLRELEDKQRL